MNRLIIRISLLFLWVVFSGLRPVQAQDVTLRSANGAVQITGTLLGYDGEFYKLRTRLGDMTLNGQGIVCTGHECPDPGDYASEITISGSRLIAESLLPTLIESYSFQTGQNVEREDVGFRDQVFHISDPADHPVTRIDLTATTSEGGFSELIAGKTDFSLTHRQASAAEVAEARESGVGDLTSQYQKRILALDGLMFIVSRENPVRAITLDQAVAIFDGSITNWADIGGIDAPIRRYLPHKASDLIAMFHQRVATEATGQMVRPQATIVANSALSDAVAADPFAIGITNFPSIRNARALGIKGKCGRAVYPTQFNLKTEDYPLTQHLYLYSTSKRPPVFARNFLAFLESGQAQAAISDLGFAGQGISYLPLSAQGGRLVIAIDTSGGENTLDDLQEMIRTFKNAARLSVTFRFKAFSTALDARSQINVKLIARALEVGEFDGKELIIAGFSDSAGSSAGNRKISQQRAAQVRSAILAAATKADPARVAIKSIGFGEISPLACNETPENQRINRRVEIWVKG